MRDGILRSGEQPQARPAGQRPSLVKWLSEPPRPAAVSSPPRPPPPEDEALALAHEAAEHEERVGPQLVVVAHKPVELVHFPPVRGLRRERLRREAEEARLRIISGAPLRLHHVIELPARDASEELGESRRVSAAAGEAARRFAPDAPLARVAGLPTDGEVPAENTPAIAPAVPSTPPPAALGGRLRRGWRQILANLGRSR
jgi:hypothetical protein